MIPRDHLLKRIGGPPDLLLTLIIAPAGFGKSTLLAQLFDHLRIAATGLQVIVWMALEATDSDPRNLLAGVATSLEQSGADIRKSWDPTSARSLKQDLREVVADLFAAIEGSQRNVTLLLDDYHLAASDETDHLMELLLEQGHGLIRLVVASRNRVRWNVSSLKVAGLVNRFQAEDLKLSLAETAQILGAQSDPHAISVVHARTDGWAMPVQLARLWLSRRIGASDELRTFGGNVDDIAEYLTGQVFEGLPPPVRLFIEETSILETFNVALADYVRGAEDSDTIVRSLKDLDALLIPLGEDCAGFRYHALLSGYLLGRLTRSRAKELHTRAARWLAGQNDWLGAIRHAMKADDGAQALAIARESGGWRMVIDKGIPYSQSVLRLFDEQALHSDAGLMLLQAYLLSRRGENTLALEMLREVEPMIGADTRLFLDFTVIEAMVRLCSDRLPPRTQWYLSPEEVERMAGRDPLAQGTLLCSGAVAALATGEVGIALSAARWANVRMRIAGYPKGICYSLFHLSQALALAGDLTESRAALLQCQLIIDRDPQADHSLQAVTDILRSWHCYLRGEWGEALPLARSALTALDHVDGWFDVYATAVEVIWRSALLREGYQAANQALERADALARDRDLPRLTRLLAVWRVEAAVQAGFLHTARSAIDEVLMRNDGSLNAANGDPLGEDWRFLEARVIAMARIEVSIGARRAALTQLESAAVHMSAKGVQLSAQRLRLHALAARVGEGVTAEGLRGKSWVEADVQPALKMSLHGLLLEMDPIVLTALKKNARSLPPELRQALNRLHAQRRKRQVQELLTAREHEVLEQLASGNTNKRIGRNLRMTERTVKFHIKNICRKLGVETRSAALLTAERRGILSPPV